MSRAPAATASRTASRARRRFPPASPTSGAIWQQATRTTKPVYTRRAHPSRCAPVVPALPPELRDLQERAARFVEEELYPAENRIVERGDIDRADVDELKAKARGAGFSNLNIPKEHGGPGIPVLGQVVLGEQEIGRG